MVMQFDEITTLKAIKAAQSERWTQRKQCGGGNYEKKEEENQEGEEEQEEQKWEEEHEQNAD